MKMTFNRQLILKALAENYDSPPPHSAWSIKYTLETAFKYEWEGIYSSMKTIPNKQQIHRTLKELWHGGLIVGNRIKEDGYNGNLPSWVIRYQLSSDVYHNWLITECEAVYRKVSKAKHGFNMFGAVFDMGLPTEEAKPLLMQVKALMQKTHPDKADGYADQFKQMKQCSDWIKSGIPLPTLTHQANEQMTLSNSIQHG